MIETFFRYRQSLARILSTPAGPHLEGLVSELTRQGFGHSTLGRRLLGAAHFSLWSERRGVSLEHLHESALPSFRKHLRACRCPLPRRSSHDDACAVAGARAFVQHLRQVTVVRSLPPSTTPPEEPALLKGFDDWMRQHRGLKDGTLHNYDRVIRDALKTLGSNPSDYTAQSLRAFVLRRTRGVGGGIGNGVVTAMRVFLRYLIVQGHCRPGMDDAIPTLATWRLATLPRYLPATDVDRIIDGCTRSTPVGLRDRAALLLLARLGLRAGDIVALKVADVDWRQASVRVAGKSRTEVRLPLTQDVGDALLQYLELGRPPVKTERFFVRMQAPWGPLRLSSVSSLVARAMLRAGVESQYRGAHVLRHSAATEMLRQGATLQQIGTVLRHQNLDTTAHYAKVDVQRLRAIALPWPEVTPC